MRDRSVAPVSSVEPGMPFTRGIVWFVLTLILCAIVFLPILFR